MQRISIRITGKVQGVSFRKYTQSKALELGLTGFVENQSNNAVYLEAQGNPESEQKAIKTKTKRKTRKRKRI